MDWRWWPLVTWAAALVLIVLAVFVQTVHHRQPMTEMVTLQDAALILKNRVKEQWAAEAAVRQVRRPVPFTLRWSSTAREVAASRRVVLGADTDLEWRDAPLSGPDAPSPGRGPGAARTGRPR